VKSFLGFAPFLWLSLYGTPSAVRLLKWQELDSNWSGTRVIGLLVIGTQRSEQTFEFWSM
jgi:hypothetical protein